MLAPWTLYTFTLCGWMSNKPNAMMPRSKTTVTRRRNLPFRIHSSEWPLGIRHIYLTPFYVAVSETCRRTEARRPEYHIRWIAMKQPHHRAKPTAPTAMRTLAACTASPEGAAALLVVMDGVLESVEAAVGFAVDIKDDIIRSPASHGNHCVLWLERARRTPQYVGLAGHFQRYLSLTRGTFIELLVKVDMCLECRDLDAKPLSEYWIARLLTIFANHQLPHDDQLQ